MISRLIFGAALTLCLCPAVGIADPAAMEKLHRRGAALANVRFYDVNETAARDLVTTALEIPSDEARLAALSYLKGWLHQRERYEIDALDGLFRLATSSSTRVLGAVRDTLSHETVSSRAGRLFRDILVDLLDRESAFRSGTLSARGRLELDALRVDYHGLRLFYSDHRRYWQDRDDLIAAAAATPSEDIQVEAAAYFLRHWVNRWRDKEGFEAIRAIVEQSESLAVLRRVSELIRTETAWGARTESMRITLLSLAGMAKIWERPSAGAVAREQISFIEGVRRANPFPETKPFLRGKAQNYLDSVVALAKRATGPEPMPSNVFFCRLWSTERKERDSQEAYAGDNEAPQDSFILRIVDGKAHYWKWSKKIEGKLRSQGTLGASEWSASADVHSKPTFADERRYLFNYAIVNWGSGPGISDPFAHSFDLQLQFVPFPDGSRAVLQVVRRAAPMGTPESNRDGWFEPTLGWHGPLGSQLSAVGECVAWGAR
jgi:hypothetical protein